MTILEKHHLNRRRLAHHMLNLLLAMFATAVLAMQTESQVSADDTQQAIKVLAEFRKGVTTATLYCDTAGKERVRVLRDGDVVFESSFDEAV